jgi:hypothetical protein
MSAPNILDYVISTARVQIRKVHIFVNVNRASLEMVKSAQVSTIKCWNQGLICPSSYCLASYILE